VLPILPMAQTTDDRQHYHDRDIDYKNSKSQQVSTQRPNNLRRKAETQASFDHTNIDRTQDMITRISNSMDVQAPSTKGRQGKVSNSVSARGFDSFFFFSSSCRQQARIPLWRVSFFCLEIVCLFSSLFSSFVV
jgi:hypothetical protein